ncbi:MAG: hypothetical protein ACXVB9_03060, partial [Bdellovibrionota bacterium]
MKTLLLALALIPLFAHADPTDLTPARWLPEGTYGSTGAALTVSAHSAQLDLPCAIGRIPNRPSLDDRGEFTVQGFYSSRLQIRPREEFPATFTGRLSGQSIWLRVIVHARGRIQNF